MERNDKDNEQENNKESIIMLLNIIKKNNKDSNVEKELDTIEKRINNQE